LPRQPFAGFCPGLLWSGAFSSQMSAYNAKFHNFIVKIEVDHASRHYLILKF
jgi:hypothetical protein